MKIEKKRRVVITGLGTVNPTGNTVAESWAAVKAGRCAVGPITAFDTTDFKVKLAAEVKDFDPAERIDRREARKMARFTQFAVAAADEAIHDSGIALENIDHTRFGVILSSGIGGLPTIEEEHTRGQQQRISIARAILKDAPIVVFDEATSYSDIENEHKIQLALQNLLRGKTTIMIAHRLHTIRNADKIVVFQDGKVVEQGTHDELIASGSTYSHMWDTYTRETIGEE